jgi:alkylation response protein AidB-like acyl-CoA dehydrogenase
MGGHGYIKDYPMERFYRSARGISILEGVAMV